MRLCYYIYIQSYLDYSNLYDLLIIIIIVPLIQFHTTGKVFISNLYSNIIHRESIVFQARDIPYKTIFIKEVKIITCDMRKRLKYK